MYLGEAATLTLGAGAHSHCSPTGTLIMDTVTMNGVDEASGACDAYLTLNDGLKLRADTILFTKGEGVRKRKGDAERHDDV